VAARPFPTSGLKVSGWGQAPLPFLILEKSIEISSRKSLVPACPKRRQRANIHLVIKKIIL
ncbi:MAG: hypothetical protein M0017_05940, partial [Desulfobacteraceae bacterium]|nr:hypothetical protein [Desulfobacteraceae bacterium]